MVLNELESQYDTIQDLHDDNPEYYNGFNNIFDRFPFQPNEKTHCLIWNRSMVFTRSMIENINVKSWECDKSIYTRRISPEEWTQLVHTLHLNGYSIRSFLNISKWNYSGPRWQKPAEE